MCSYSVWCSVKQFTEESWISKQLPEKYGLFLYGSHSRWYGAEHLVSLFWHAMPVSKYILVKKVITVVLSLK